MTAEEATQELQKALVRTADRTMDAAQAAQFYAQKIVAGWSDELPSAIIETRGVSESQWVCAFFEKRVETIRVTAGERSTMAVSRAIRPTGEYDEAMDIDGVTLKLESESIPAGGRLEIRVGWDDEGLTTLRETLRQWGLGTD